jgi:D-glycero-D-manno-heptose 1,7-bisphosphate phosphatase
MGGSSGDGRLTAGFRQARRFGFLLSHGSARFSAIIPSSILWTTGASRAVATRFQDIRNVFLDRDGVINRKPAEGEYISDWRDFHPLPGVEEAIAALNRAGIRVILVSNQRGIALGRATRNDIESIHNCLQQHLAGAGAHIDAFYYCPHDRNECDCRKPKTGLFEQAFRDFPDANRSTSLVIGDSLSDLQVARTLGLSSILIEGDPASRKPGWEQAVPLADAVAPSLSDAVNRILA